MQPTLGKLPDNLRAGGLSPQDVTHIVLTHLHPDHANGLVDDAGHAVYPNAEIVVLAREHDFWMSDDGAGDSEMVRKTRARNRVNLAPYRERLRLVRDGEEVLGCTRCARRVIRPAIPAGALRADARHCWPGATWCICHAFRSGTPMRR